MLDNRIFFLFFHVAIAIAITACFWIWAVGVTKTSLDKRYVFFISSFFLNLRLFSSFP